VHTSTIAKVPADFFEPPPTVGTTRRQRRRRVALSVVVLLAVVSGGLAARQIIVHGCRGLDWPDANLTRVDGECIGWTDDRAFAFEPGLADVTEKIAQENREVLRRASEDGMGYVKVAVLMPMTSADGSAMSALTILHSLQGVYIAQLRANRSPDFGTPSPLIELVLMNEGRDQSHWPEMVKALEGMRSGTHPVVAAVGLGVSIPATKEVAKALSTLGIPAIGGVLTATDLSTPGLFQVSPSNEDYVTALQSYLSGRPELKIAVLAYDTNNDNYVASLRRAFERPDLASYIDGRVKGFDGSLGARNATAAVFDDVKQSVCYTNADLVFYAGRDRDLLPLVAQLANRRQCGHQKPVVILTGSTGLNLLDETAKQTMTKSQITLIDASSSDPVGWLGSSTAPAGYEAFYHTFVRDFAEQELHDGYAIGHHDALATVAWAIRRFALQAANRVPSGQNLLTQISNLNDRTLAVPAAGGTLTFDGSGKGWPHGKVVALIQVPGDNTGLTSFTTP
jgi:hypothetical protein